MTHDRRQVLRAAAAALALPLASRWPSPAHAQPPGLFVPPPDPYAYTRTLERSMADGAAFSVSRRFAVRFLPEKNGYCVDGQQVAVAVDAPEALAAFAQIERERREWGLFPICLDRRGLIESAPGEAAVPSHEHVVETALARIERLEVPATERASLTAFIRSVHDNLAQLLTALPHDLFAPHGEQSRNTRLLALPGGEEGRVTVSYSAQAEPATGLMRTAQREVITQIADSERRTVERWTLEPLA